MAGRSRFLFTTKRALGVTVGAQHRHHHHHPVLKLTLKPYLASKSCSNLNHDLFAKAFYCTTNMPYQPDEIVVEYKNGFPTINIMLPSRDEMCLFTLKPLTDTVGSLLSMVMEEDGGIERIALYRTDGTKIAKATTIDLLLQEDFDLLINDRKFAIKPPKIDLSADEKAGLGQVKDMVSQLYATMNLADWQSLKERDLQKRVEYLQHELQPYIQLRDEMIEASDKRTNRLTWLGLGLMGVQFGFLARLTWWEYSWDIMEPVTYFVTYGTSIAMFAYYVLTKQEYVFTDVKGRLMAIHFHKNAKKKQFDIEHYDHIVAQLAEAEASLKQLKQPLGLPTSEILKRVEAKKN